MHALNSWIPDPADSDKTSRTRRPPCAVAIIDEIDSADDGKPRTDSPTCQQQRGVTLTPAVVALVLDREAGPGSGDLHATLRRRSSSAGQVSAGATGGGVTAAHAAGLLAPIKRTDVPQQEAQAIHG